MEYPFCDLVHPADKVNSQSRELWAIADVPGDPQGA